MNFLQHNNYGYFAKNSTDQYPSYSLDNAWLSGFIDGRSMFYLRTVTNAKVNGLFIRPVIQIRCASTDTANNINELFTASRIASKVSHIVQFTSVKACCQLLDYLPNFPLKIKYAEQIWFNSGLTRLINKEQNLHRYKLEQI